MRLKYNRSIVDSVVTVHLSISNLSINERRALKTLGSPNVVFEESYKVSGTSISIDTTLDNFNNLGNFVFAANSVEEVNEVLDEVADFISGIHMVLCETLTTLMMAYAEIKEVCEKISGDIEITDGFCHPCMNNP